VLDSFNGQEELDQINPSQNRFVFLCLIKTCFIQWTRSVQFSEIRDGDYVMKIPGAPNRRSFSTLPVMAIVGIGSRSSPIVIDDDDDEGPIPPKAKPGSSSSSSVKETPPQQSTSADIAPTRHTTPARQEKPDQLRSGKGYSILVRMGYKPGYGLGVNLEGIGALSSFLLGG
jgi:hypothetical protein